MISSIFSGAVGLATLLTALLCLGVIAALGVVSPVPTFGTLAAFALLAIWIRDGIRKDRDRREANRPIEYDGIDPRLPSALDFD